MVKFIPFYLIILLGFIAARLLRAQKETVAKLLIYIIVPIVIFFGTLQVKLTVSVLSLPILFCAICTILSLVFILVGKRLWAPGDNTKNLLAFTAGSANTGYFGLPVGIMIFGNDAFGIITLCTLGYVVFENTLGFFITARGNYSAKESFYKLLKIPTVYAFFLGLSVNFLRLDLGSVALGAMENFKSAYTVLGMMMIGMGLAAAKKSSFDFKLIFSSFAAKFIVWPLVMFIIIYLDKTYFHIYSEFVRNVLFYMSILPLAANTVTFATELNVKPEKAAVAVLLSTVFVLFYIPFMMSFIL